MEFLELPQHEATLDDPQTTTIPFTSDIFHNLHTLTQNQHSSPDKLKLKDTLTRYQNKFSQLDSKQKLHDTIQRNKSPNINVGDSRAFRNPEVGPQSETCSDLQQPSRTPCESSHDLIESVACFASHGSYGVVDLGATKTVIGSQFVPSLLQGLKPDLKKQVTRCPCKITFRFGNQGILQSEQALVIPVANRLLKVAVVPGSTPFLLSNTLLRAMSAIIDTERQLLFSKNLSREVPMTLTDRGLFLIDINDLAQTQVETGQFSEPAETHMTLRVDPKDQTSSQPSETQAASDVDPVSETMNTDSVQLAPCHEPRVHSQSPAAANSQDTPAFVIQSPAVDRTSHDPCDSPPEAPGGCCPGEDRFQSSVTAGTGRDHDRLRSHPCGSHLSRHVDDGTELDSVVCPALQQVEQAISPEADLLHREHGGAHGVDRRSPSHRISPSCNGFGTSSSGQSSSKELCGTKLQSQGQTRACAKPRWPMGRRRCDQLDRDGSLACSHPDPDRGSSPSTPRQDAQHGECPHPSDQFHREQRPCEQRELRDLECPSVAAVNYAGDVSAECHLHTTLAPQTNKERQLYLEWIQLIENELHQTLKTKVNRPKIQVLEVFCHENSQLTHQCERLNIRARRFGYQQGDLSTSSGRKALFDILVNERPEHIWYSPTCGPWSGFSNLNGSRSIVAWDQLQKNRNEHMYQLALGTVLLRYQLQCHRHLHWEQPRPSLMLKVPYMQEVRYYTQCVDVDLCVAGNLTDPENGKPIKKGLTIFTTSRHMVTTFQGLRCHGHHEHQTIEGTVRVKGKTLNRSTFSERYPRKFARRLAITMSKISTCGADRSPEGLTEPTLVGSTLPESAPKRPKLDRQKPSRAREISSLSWGKRRKCLGKTTPVDHVSEWQLIFDKINATLPRVGKRTFSHADQPDLLQQIQELIGDKTVVYVVACRGTNRTLPPPNHIQKGEAPWRRSIFTERGTQVMKAEEEWEFWENLAKRNIIRAANPSKINITVFAKDQDIPSTSYSSNVPTSIAPQQVPSDASNSSEIRPAQSEDPADPPNVPDAPTLTPAQKADVESPNQTKQYQELSSEERIMISRAHKNLGHPSPERLSSLLRSQGYRPEVAQAALDFKCSICQASCQPKLARPGSIRDDLDFNDRISMDGITWTNKDGTNYHAYHVIDWATSFHAACIAPDRSSSAVISNLITMWFAWAGAPSELLVDAATELNSDQFSEFMQEHGIKLQTISPEAQFQNGKAERHGSILKTMLSKFEKDHAINNYQDFQQALFWCVQAKNACSLRKGYAPEVLVLGKHTRIPGSISSDELLPAHLLADAETAQGIQFRKQLAYRESARKAFHSADNDAALRRALLRRSRPGTYTYAPGEWVMVWRQGKGNLPGMWIGPQKVVIHENAQTIWTTVASKLYRSAPENVRPVTAMESKDITMYPQEPSVSIIAQQLPSQPTQGITRDVQLPYTEPINPGPVDDNTSNNPHAPSIPSEQPDNEPEITSNSPPDSNPSELPELPTEEPIVQTPELDVSTIPVPSDEDDELQCVGLHCLDVESILFTEAAQTDLAWRCEIEITDRDVEDWKQEENHADMAFVVSAAKRQRSEVKLSTLSTIEKEEFQKAKMAEVDNWIKTGTISRILRDKIPHDQILRCRWILTWKPIDPDPKYPGKTTKAKARLVILGYLDPKLEELPRDSPTLGRHAKMLALQLIASKQWLLQSFDIRAAFLQGKAQQGRTLAIEPVIELSQALGLTSREVCKLEKGAYGLVDAPYLWYVAICEELNRLGFIASPFDPCLFILRHETTNNLEGVLGLHVDDGICGGSSYFHSKIAELEKKYPFGSKKNQSFTFTGIDMNQHPGGTITMNQSKYIRNINPIKITNERRSQNDEKVTEDERQQLRALVGSLQYASVHTRPDLASRLSMLQSAINRATVETLISANQTLHEAKRHHDVTIKIHPIHIDDFRFLAFSDASFASKSNPNSHTGCMIMGTHQQIKNNTSCLVSPLAWSCKKIQRVVTSTLAAETVSLNSVLDQLSWMRLCWGWMLDNTINWKNPSKTLKDLPETYTTATYQAQHLPESIAATDCKSLFDLVSRTAMPNCAEFRTQLNARAIKDLLSEGVSLRWVHSGAQLADALTEIMDTSFMRETLKLGRYRLHDELAVLKDRASARNRLKWLRESQNPSDHQGCNDCLFSEILEILGV